MKGFIFTIDAIIAISAIMLLLGTWAYISNIKTEHSLQYADLNSFDAATVSFYLNENGYSSNSKEYACNSYVKYVSGAFAKKDFCEGLK